MTLERYQSSVRNRWEELSSSETDTPMKIKFQRLRNIRRRPACGCYEVSRDLHIDDYEARVAGNGTVMPQLSVSEDSLANGVDMRSASETLNDLFSKVTVDDTVYPSDSISQCDLPEASVLERVVTSAPAPTYEGFYLSRGERRAYKNNKFIRDKVTELRAVLRKQNSRFRSTRDERIRANIAEIEAGIRNLLSQESDLDEDIFPREGMYKYPPPVEQPSNVRRHRKDTPYKFREERRPSLRDRFLPPCFSVIRKGYFVPACVTCHKVLDDMFCVNSSCTQYKVEFRQSR